MTKWKHNFFFVGAILFFSIGIFGQKVPLEKPEELKKKLLQQAEETKSIIASFKREEHLSIMKKAQISTGEFYYEKSDKMRWEQQSPFDYVLLINNGLVRIKDNGEEKNVKGVKKMMGKINTLMLSLVNGKILESKEFDTEFFEDNEYYIIVLYPKNKRLKSIFTTIELNLSPKTKRLKKLIFTDKSGDTSIMSFFDEKFNQPIDQKIFKEL